MDKNINEFLGSLQNSIEQKKKKLRLDETVIMKMHKSTEPGTCETEALKLLVGVSHENDVRVNGYHVLCDHCDAVLNVLLPCNLKLNIILITLVRS